MLNIAKFIQYSRAELLIKDTALLGHDALKKISIEGCHVFAIEKDDQKIIADYSIVIDLLSKIMGISNAVIQVVGDSAPYSEETSAFLMVDLKRRLSASKNSIIFYGATGKLVDTQHDVNGLMNALVDSEPDEYAHRVVANLVDGDSMKAVTEWGYSVSSHVKYFTLVYTSDLPGARFSDDVILTDSMTNAKLICYEGGLQSFLQVCNVLNNDVKVEGVFNLRQIDERAGIYKFSAAEFLYFVRELVIKNPDIGEEGITQCRESYLAGELNGRKYFLYKKSELGTKDQQQLFETAWDIFMKNKLWKKLSSLAIFENFNVLKEELKHNRRMLKR